MSGAPPAPMLVLVEIDIALADMALFDDYEARALALLAAHGGAVAERVRAVDGTREVHLLRFRDGGGLAAFRADPARAALQPLWARTGASAVVREVHRLPPA